MRNLHFLKVVFWCFLIFSCGPAHLDASDSKSAAEFTSASGEPTPVKFVDLKKYLGTWFEIASYPQRFQKGCHCTRARYSLNDDQTLAVVNSCNRDSVSGKYTEASAVGVVQKAAIADGSYSRLKVYFFLPWLRLFGGDYWIVGLDENYRWAVVSDPSGDYLWILARTPQMAPADLEQAKVVIQKNGLDLGRLQWAVHEGCSYPE